MRLLRQQRKEDSQGGEAELDSWGIPLADAGEAGELGDGVLGNSYFSTFHNEEYSILNH